MSLRSLVAYSLGFVDSFGPPHSLEGEAMGVRNIATDIVTGLTTTGSKKFGKSLIEEAQAKNREALKGAVVGKVQEILVHVTKQREYIAQSEKNVALLEAQIAAIEAGAFSVTPYGVITLHDEALQKGVVRMTECTNCGYGGRKSI